MIVLRERLMMIMMEEGPKQKKSYMSSGNRCEEIPSFGVTSVNDIRRMRCCVASYV